MVAAWNSEAGTNLFRAELVLMMALDGLAKLKRPDPCLRLNDFFLGDLGSVGEHQFHAGTLGGTKVTPPGLSSHFIIIAMT